MDSGRGDDDRCNLGSVHLERVQGHIASNPMDDLYDVHLLRCRIGNVGDGNALEELVDREKRA